MHLFLNLYISVLATFFIRSVYQLEISVSDENKQKKTRFDQRNTMF